MLYFNPTIYEDWTRLQGRAISSEQVQGKAEDWLEI
jgi:hypothetical protein